MRIAASLVALVAGVCTVAHLGCEKGLSPTEYEEPSPMVSFAVQPEGGDPTGAWRPASERPFEVAFVDSSQIQALVDSLVLETQLEGNFQFDPFGNYRVDARLAITPKVYIAFFRDPLILPPVPDTLIGNGTYENFENAATMILHGLRTSNFSLDTLGYTVRLQPNGKRVLELISVPNTFPYPGFEWIQFYFVFRLEEASGSAFTEAAPPTNGRRKVQRGAMH